MHAVNGTISLTHEDGIADIIIDRPDKHNALTSDMYAQFGQICREVNANDEIRAVVISGAGTRAFCAGSDINSLQDYDDIWAWRNRDDYIANLLSVRKPVIAALKGWALGGGFEIALAADIRIASETTVISAPEVTLGWTGAGGAAQHLTRLIGYGQAMRILLTGDRINAKEAFDMGIFEDLCTEGEELIKAHQLAKKIAENDTVATQSIKAAIRAAMSGSLQDGLKVENDLMAICFAKNNVLTPKA